MKQKTSTQQLNQVISNNLLNIIKAEIYNKTSKETNVIDAALFKENLDFLFEAGIFADFIDWNYERNLSKKGEYIIESGAMNSYSDNIVTAYLRVSDGANVEDIERVLKIEEE